MPFRNLFLRIVVGGLLVSTVRVGLRADDFFLKTGARVRGRWLNRDDAATPLYLVATEHGGRVSLERSQVAQVVCQSEVRDRYDRLAPTLADAAEDHWKLARWCRDNDLQEQSEQHLLRAIELDPEHEAARRALGYAEIGGQWVKQEEYLARRGYVRYKGKWRLPQEIALAEQRHNEEFAKKDWYIKLSRWRSQLNKENRHEALDHIRQVRDPLAIEAIGKLLRAEQDRRMRIVYVEVLGQIQDDRAVAALVELALADRDEEVYYACVEQLAPRKTPPLVRQFVLALKSQHNPQVNRAAIALRAFGDQSVIPPLIDALVTQHEEMLPGSDRMTTTFASGGWLNQSGDSFTSGPSAPRVVTRTAANQEVLKTLVALTGVSFSFDERAWTNWYTLEQRRQPAPTADARRID